MPRLTRELPTRESNNRQLYQLKGNTPALKAFSFLGEKSTGVDAEHVVYLARRHAIAPWRASVFIAAALVYNAPSGAYPCRFVTAKSRFMFSWLQWRLYSPPAGGAARSNSRRAHLQTARRPLQRRRRPRPHSQGAIPMADLRHLPPRRVQTRLRQDHSSLIPCCDLSDRCTISP